MKERKIIQELVGEWVTFAEARPEPNLKSFSKWLYERHNPSQTVDTSNMQAKKMELGELFGRLINFTELWVRLAFKDLPIRHFEDYGILNAAKHHPNPSKNDLANILLDQKSTAFEIIKRLIRDGLLWEEIEREDKRMRRVRLTPYGEEVFEQASIQARKVANLIMGDLSDSEVLAILEKFRELDRFHKAKYEKGGFVEIDDLLS